MNESHRFINGERPNSETAEYFLHRIIKYSFEAGTPFVVTDSAILHYAPSPTELKTSRDWFSAHSNQIVCPESGMPLQFFSQEGCSNGCEMFSADQGDPSRAADEIGQVWICGSWFWNRLMGDMIPTDRAVFLTKLIALYDSRMADAVIHCYLDDLTDADANAYLLPFHIGRNFNVIL